MKPFPRHRSGRAMFLLPRGQALLAALCLLGGATVARATTYYVDPASGLNSNAGTSPSSPWRTPPGTRNSGNTGFVSSTWGSVSSTSKIKCGDTIFLKGGATQTSTQGGAWVIDPVYYSTTCTNATPITIQVALASDWSGAAGNFTLDLSGVTGSSTTARGGEWTTPTGIFVAVGGVVLRGRDTGDQILVKGSSPSQGITGVIFACPNCSTHITQILGSWLTLTSMQYGFNAGEADSWVVSNSTCYNTQHSCWQTGVNNDHHVSQAAFVDVVGHDAGCGSSANPSCTTGNGSEDVFFSVGAYSLWYVRCTAYNGGERGFNTGVINDTNMGGDYVWRFRDIVTYNHGNGPTNPCNTNGHWCAGAGWDVSGNDFETPPGLCPGRGACCLGTYGSTCGASLAGSQYGTCSGPGQYYARNYVQGARAWGNRGEGFSAYGGAVIEIWNATTFNAWASGLSALGSYNLDTTGAGVLIANAIDLKAPGNAVFSGTPQNSNGCEPQATYTPAVYRSCFRSASSDSEPLGSAAASGWPGSGTYASPPRWIGATNQTTRATCSPNLVATSASSWSANNWALCTGVNTPTAGCPGPSTAIDAGTTPLLANGAGSGNTIAVRANLGDSGDPRNYLIAQTGSYLAPLPADTQVQIQGACGVRHVVSMTATTVTFDGSSCSWSDGAMVGRPWNGNAPDQGAIESGGTGVAPPVLIGVQPLAQ
ncbi:MAG TPA: hypothetical protein VKW76_05440 [Candidatus Binatia bacterium]|nr:hypothetical protein [Candidatus Binatia bacterium]